MKKKLNKLSRKDRKYNFYFRRHLLLFSAFVFFLFPNFAFFSNIAEQDIINLSNEIRLEQQLGKLKPNHLLIEAAQKKAEDILKHETFEHNFNDTTFSDWVKDSQYDYYYVGENLAIDFLVSEKVMNAWMDSETHRANILNENFTEIGVAVVDGKFKDRNTTIVVQIFGSPMSSIVNAGEISSINQIDPNEEVPVLSNQNNSNKVNNFLIILLATTAFIVILVKVAVVSEHYYQKKKIKSKIKAKVNL